MDLNTYKRKLFFQKLSSTTTEASLRQYLSSYPIEKCTVPSDEKGKNKSHAIVTFTNAGSIYALMSRRPHNIDGQEIKIHRSVPNQGPLKDNYDNQNLIVSGLGNDPQVISDIRSHFSPYGTLRDIYKIDNDWVVYFDDYDSVDKAILASPHCIERITITVKKGDRYLSRRQSATPESTSATNNNNNGVVPKASNLKRVTMNEQTSYVGLPARIYHIHITNIPPNTDAEMLSKEFRWNIYSIVMNPSVKEQSSLTECWLKNENDEGKVDDFVRYWNGRSIGGFVIHCEKEEDQLELCNKYQFGLCSKSDANCHWEHVECTANGTCSSACPYGHPVGMKSEDNSRNKTVTAYRIKATGFRSAVIPQNLAQLLHLKENSIYVDRKHDYIGYVVKIKTMKYAKQLITMWHDKEIDGQKLKCQLELNPISFVQRARSQSRAGSTDGELTCSSTRNKSRPRHAGSVQSSQETSVFDDADIITSTAFDNREAERDRRLIGKAMEGIVPPVRKTSLHQASSPESIASLADSKYRLPSDVPANVWEITNKATGSDKKVLLIRGIVERKRLAVIKTYENQRSENYDRELRVLKDLKDMKSVAQLIEPENSSNNSANRNVNKVQWLIMKRAPGCSLKEFMERKDRGTIGVTEAIQLALNLVGIVKQMHNKSVFHQNLSPENIMIEWDSNHDSINHAQLTLLNFSQAVSASSSTDLTIASSTQKWYQPLQATTTLSSTVDASGVCAIIFWLLTQMDPQHNNDELPHQQAREKLNQIIDRAIKSTNVNRKVTMEAGQLQNYLMDTFDHGFGYPHYHLWTINDLECRLESIRELLLPSDVNLNTIDAIFQQLVSISDLAPPPSVLANSVQQDAFQKASKAFYLAKKYFLEGRQDQYSWSDGYCAWVESPVSSLNECRHDDVLTYQSLRGRMVTSYPVIVTCLASLSEDGYVMTLSIGSSVNGKMNRIPIGHFSIAQDYVKDVQENFQTELKSLLLAIYKERKSVQ